MNLGRNASVLRLILLKVKSSPWWVDSDEELYGISASCRWFEDISLHIEDALVMFLRPHGDWGSSSTVDRNLDFSWVSFVSVGFISCVSSGLDFFCRENDCFSSFFFRKSRVLELIFWGQMTYVGRTWVLSIDWLCCKMRGGEDWSWLLDLGRKYLSKEIKIYLSFV